MTSSPAVLLPQTPNVIFENVLDNHLLDTEIESCLALVCLFVTQHLSMSCLFTTVVSIDPLCITGVTGCLARCGFDTEHLVPRLMDPSQTIPVLAGWFPSQSSLRLAARCVNFQHPSTPSSGHYAPAIRLFDSSPSLLCTFCNVLSPRRFTSSLSSPQC